MPRFSNKKPSLPVKKTCSFKPVTKSQVIDNIVQLLEPNTLEPVVEDIVVEPPVEPIVEPIMEEKKIESPEIVEPVTESTKEENSVRELKRQKSRELFLITVQQILLNKRKKKVEGWNV